jgi:ppGpp synthetase/RelA/SpoT-type nucleotidyltranferase
MPPPFDPPTEEQVQACLAAYKEHRHNIDTFGTSVRGFLAAHPELISGDLPAIHSTRYRMKGEDHLAKKIVRKKVEEDRLITPETLLKDVTDLSGVRVLHLHKEQFVQIHKVIMQQVADRYWALFEPPKAYTWDPEFETFFEELGLRIELKESHYTSVHYVVKPNEELPLTCEIQVRTLFEEVWGEIDHVLNYPTKTGSIACAEQLRVMAKMVGAGTRLAEAIFRSHKEFVATAEGQGKQAA